WNSRGKPITVEIYRDLNPWESSMRPEFLLAQNTVPAAVASINASLAVDPSVARVVQSGSVEMVEALPPGHINNIVLPVYVKEAGLQMGGGGCGCRVSSETVPLAAILYFFVIFMPVPVFLYTRSRYYRSRSRRSKS
ncbi:MAG: hypothetical protein Q7S68_04275, partial [Deltaproteobacteria bacterium]|nr:hypothetical protein [Deltaproteobacteria bacterium]